MDCSSANVSPSAPQRLLHVVLIKPTHYDDDGYPIQCQSENGKKTER